MEAFKIDRIFFESETLCIIMNNQKYQFNLREVSDKLAQANEKDRNDFKVSPSGYGIHWPTLDEDLSINGLLNLVKKRHVA